MVGIRLSFLINNLANRADRAIDYEPEHIPDMIIRMRKETSR